MTSLDDQDASEIELQALYVPVTLQ